MAKNVEARFNDKAKASGEELIRARTQVDQANVTYNEAVYLHALGLAALERVTAGGFRLSSTARHDHDEPPRWAAGPRRALHGERLNCPNPTIKPRGMKMPPRSLRNLKDLPHGSL